MKSENTLSFDSSDLDCFTRYQNILGLVQNTIRFHLTHHIFHNLQHANVHLARGALVHRSDNKIQTLEPPDYDIFSCTHNSPLNFCKLVSLALHNSFALSLNKTIPFKSWDIRLVSVGDFVIQPTERINFKDVGNPNIRLYDSSLFPFWNNTLVGMF